jgi:tagaturonate epimerase
MILPKYSIGMGDRFARQGPAQLDAAILAGRDGVQIAPVWNKSHREHTTIGSRPEDVRAEADAAVRARGWTGPYFVDADHVGLRTVDAFLAASDFFTIDVADRIGVDAGEEVIEAFVGRWTARLESAGSLLRGNGLSWDKRNEFRFTIARNEFRSTVRAVARKFLAAVGEAGRIYRRIHEAKWPKGDSPIFADTKIGTVPWAEPVIEVSMDETADPQTPVELLVILAAAADEGIPIQTIAPRFPGQFHKGVDYIGDVAVFQRQFEQYLAVVATAVAKFGLPANLKLSVHSGSDKFALYRPMRESLAKFDAGVHLKTAGTTWLEELIGLATAGRDGLAICNEVYESAYRRLDELCAPYSAVVAIDRRRLPAPEDIARWDGETFAAALRHDATCATYNPHLRQLLHVGYKVAAELGGRFTTALERHADAIAAGVTHNLYQRHIRPLFIP